MRALSDSERAIYKRYCDAKKEWERRKYGTDARTFGFAQLVEAHDRLKYNFRAVSMVRRVRKREWELELRKKGRLLGKPWEVAVV